MAELVRRVAFTLGVLLLYRLGSHIPLPGIDADLWSRLLLSESSNLRSMMLFTSGIHRLAIFALNLTPYISAAVILQLATMVCRPMRVLNGQGERGRELMRKITLGVTALLAALQAYGVALGIEDGRAGGIVAMPKSMFVVSTVVTLTGGALLLAWLSEQITSRGVGNGIALILLAGSTSALREPILAIRHLAIDTFASSKLILTLLILVVGVTALIVLMERARRSFKIQYPERRIGDRVLNGVSASLPIKLNPAGIIPAVLAAWLLSILITITDLASKVAPHLVTPGAVQLIVARPVHIALYAILIFVCAILYAAYLLDPESLAERLREQGGTIAAVEPGEPTAAYFDHVLSRITLVGAGYLTLICLLPDLVVLYAKVPVYFGGTLLLVLVCTALDLEGQVRGSLAQYLRS
jgi:preprotein translocase subunit SecY